MARQGNHGKDDTRAVSWFDVSVMLQNLHNSYEGAFVVVMDIEGARKASGAIWVRVCHYADGNTRGKAVNVVAKLWPNNQNRTMAGMVFQMLHSMDHVVDAYERGRAGADVPF